jgi:hypothetical protein
MRIHQLVRKSVMRQMTSELNVKVLEIYVFGMKIIPMTKIKSRQKTQRRSGRESKNRRHFAFSSNNNTSMTSAEPINNSRLRVRVETVFK